MNSINKLTVLFFARVLGGISLLFIPLSIHLYPRAPEYIGASASALSSFQYVNLEGIGEVVRFDDTYVDRVAVERYGSPIAAMGMIRRPWTDGRINYSFDPEVSLEIRNLFEKAFREWETDTPLQFVERTDQPNYIFIKYDENSWSAVGMGGGRQLLTTAHNESFRTALHELGHAIGLHHEHQRRDRSEYIEIFPENLNGNFGTQITLTVPSVNYTPYDFRSIMHYGRFTLSTNGKETIRPKEPYLEYLDVIGSVTTVSDLDREGVRNYYALKPILVSPLGSRVFADSVSFRWTGIPDALDYQIQVATDTNFSDIVVDETVTDVDDNDLYTIEEQALTLDHLAAYSEFSWRVRARVNSGFKAWSEVSMFNTKWSRRWEFDNATVHLRNFPNPFSTKTTFVFQNRSDGSVTMNIIDLQGRVVDTPLSRHMFKGWHTVEWTPKGLASGIYICQLIADQATASAQVHYLRE